MLALSVQEERLAENPLLELRRRYDAWRRTAGGDMHGLSENMRSVAATQPGQPGSASFDASRSYLEEVKNFEGNTNIKAKLTYRSNRSVPLPSLPDGRFIPVTLHYTLAALPEVPMVRRRGDDRVGNFLTVHKDFSSDTERDFFRRF